MKSSMFQRNQSLPMSQSETQLQQPGVIRRRLSSLSLNLKYQQSAISSSTAAAWAFRRSKSVSSMGEYAGGSIKKWWEWGLGWILSRKPTFARDLEMNEEETAAIGCHNKGSWRHVFYKVTSQIRRKIAGADNLRNVDEFQLPAKPIAEEVSGTTTYKHQTKPPWIVIKGVFCA